MTNPRAPISLPLVSVPTNAALRKLGDPAPAGSCLSAKGTYHLTSSSLLLSRRCPLQSRLVTTAKRTGMGSLSSYDVVYNRLKKDSREWRARFKCLVSRLIGQVPSYDFKANHCVLDCGPINLATHFFCSFASAWLSLRRKLNKASRLASWEISVCWSYFRQMRVVRGPCLAATSIAKSVAY